MEQKKLAEPKVKPAAERVECQFQAQVEKEIKINEPMAVEVVVSRRGLSKIRDGFTGGESRVGVLKNKKLIIRIRALTECVVEGEDEKTMDVPEDKAQTKVFFTITAKKKGTIVFQLEFLQGQVLLSTIRLEPTCIGRNGQSSTPLTQKVNASIQKQYPTKIIQLFNREEKQGGRVGYQFELHAPSIGIFQQYRSEPIIGSRNSYVKRLYKEIESLGTTSAFDTKDFINKLKVWGADLYTQLIPKTLGRALFQNREKITSIQVVSTEPFIPWELLLIKNPDKNGYSNEDLFLGEMGVVRWLFGRSPTQDLLLRKDRARYVIPEYENEGYVLEETEAEEEFLRKKLGATQIPPDPKRLLSLFKKKNSFDLLHFACHGQADSKKIERASLLLQERKINGVYVPTYLTQTEVQESPDFTSLPQGLRPMVVVNACEAGRRGFQLTTMGGFAQAFISLGAGLFVGASWSVGDKATRTQKRSP